MVKKYLLAFAIGALLGAAICGGLVYRSGAGRIAELGGQLEQAATANQRLAGQLTERETLLNQLAAANNKLTRSIDDRQGIIDAARAELESSKSSIAKIRALLELIKNSKYNSDTSSGS